jgi:cobalt/nickel transport system permease protein
MHIPDGYLSPSTCAVGYAVAVPVWMVASRRVAKVVKSQNIPMLAVFSALSFLVMMFNIPIPDGTTAHAVGGVIIAIALGPWAAVIAVSVALLFQALLFGDGGVLAYGVNVVNMAILLPFAGYGVYRLMAGAAPLTSRRRVIAAAAGGYVGINAAALAAAVEFGIQPDLFTTSSGAPLYSPYHLSQTIPAMAIPHLTIAGLAEAIMTAGVLAYLQRTDVTRLAHSHSGVPISHDDRVLQPRRLNPARVALGFMAVMVVLTPLGLLAPGGAFGEDDPADLKLNDLGLSSVPQGLDEYHGFWSHTLLNGYGFDSGDHANLAYILSAVIGILAVGAVIFALGTLVQRVAGRRDHKAVGHTARTSTAELPSGSTAVATPDWLLSPNAGTVPSGRSGKRKRRSFVEKTVAGGSTLLRQAMFSDDTASRNGLLQRVDARAKIAGLVGLLIVAALLHNIVALAAMYVGAVVLAAASRLPVGFFVKRVWLFIPIFTLIVIAPATLSVVTHGDIVLELWTWHGTPQGITSQGLESAGLVVSRVAVSISLVVLLTLTTPWTRLLAALRSLGVPRIFILVIAMAYRYIFLLLGSVTDMYESRKSRTLGAQRHDAGARRFATASAGALFGKASHLADEVHQAMVSRGYRGDAKTLDASRLGLADALFVAAAAVAGVLILMGDGFLGR